MLNKTVTNMCGFSLALFICGHFNSHSAALANIGIYLGILTAIIYFIINHNNYRINNFHSKQDKVWKYSCYSVFLFLAIFLILSLIHLFENNSLPLKTLIKDLVQSTLLTFILLLTIREKETIKKWIFTGFIILNLFLMIKAGIIIIESNQETIKPLTQGIIDFYLIALPFTICALFIAKYKSLKAVLAIIAILTIFFSACTGIRASLGSILGSTVILILILYWKLNSNFKTILYSSVLMAILLIITVQFIPKGVTKRAFNSHTINQFSSGRMDIITERLPLVLEYGEFIGMGYGQYSNIEYETFMFKHNAPHVGGGVREITHHSSRIPKGSKYNYLNDEPYILTVFYQGGILAVIGFLIMLFFIYLLLFLNIKQVNINLNKLRMLELLAISCSLISYGLMSIFDFMSLNVYIPLIIFAMYFSHKPTPKIKANSSNMHSY